MFRTDTKLRGIVVLALALLPFIITIGLYVFEAHYLRYQATLDNGLASASPKLVPLPAELWDGFVRSAFEKDRNGDYRLWLDTVASMQRFVIGMAFVSTGVIMGLYMGLFPLVEALFRRFFVFLDKIPPLLLLPILFILFDVGEFSKVMLVVIGVLPGVVLDAYGRTKEITRDQIYKAQTLGASESEIAWCVIFPQIVPKMLGTLRLNFKAAWGYVIAGESIAAMVGIGYKVFVMRRYVAMDVIIPYVLWATFLMFTLDFAFQWLEKRYRWADK